MINSRAEERNLLREPGVARALRVIMFVALAANLSIAAFTLILGWRLVPWLSFLAAASVVAGLSLRHFGWVRPGILIALVGIAYAVMHAAAKNDGIQSIGLAAIPVLIVIGSLLLERLVFVLFTASTICAAAGMLAIRYYVLKVKHYSTGDLGDFFIFAVICAGAAVVGRLLSVRIDEGFRLLEASERRYRRIFENIQDVYFEMRRDGTLLELSPAAAVLFGVPCEAMIGQSLAPFCANKAEFEGLLTDVLLHGSVSNCEIRIANSGPVPVRLLVNASLQIGGEGGQERVIGSIRDITEWRLAQEALRESEERLQLALDATGAGTFDYYPQPGKLILSAITRSQLGIPPEAEVGGEIILRAVHPDDRERVRQAQVAAAIPGEGGQFALECRTIGVEDGKQRWLAVMGRMVFDSENRAARLVGTTLDITERKRLEEELRRRAEELQKITDVAPVALFAATDAECREVTVNRTGSTMLEIPQDPHAPALALQGAAPPFRAFRIGIEIPVDELPLQTAARGLEVRDCELEVLLSNGKRKLLWGNASPLRDAAGCVRGAIAAFQDVTEVRLRTEARLRESEERFQEAADAAPVKLGFGDTGKRLIFVNEAMVRFTGLSAGELLGHGWGQVIHPDDLERARATYFQSMDARQGYQLEYRARRADGEYRHLLGTTNPRYIGTEYAGLVGSVVDITDLKRRQQEILASQKLESVGVLASGIAHDFNNLLGSVLAQSELALSELAEGVNPQEELKRIAEVATRGSEIVRQLMLYAGKESERPAVADLSQIVEDMLQLVNLTVPKRVVLTTDLGRNLPAVRAGATHIQQIIMNLVTNASEAISDREGAILVTTGCVTTAGDTFGPDGKRLPAGEYLCLQVSDTGCGVAPDTQAKMFDPFFSTKAAGRGMGLAVVQGIVRDLHGAIDIASQPGKGTTFRVLLPCAEKTALPALADLPREQKSPGRSEGATILIVEDEHLFRQSVSKMLSKEGFSIIEAGDGSAALEIIRAQEVSIDLLLLDITLPGASSCAVLEEARVRIPEARVIATSAYSESSAAASLKGKPEYFIQKPYRFGDLVNLVRQALTRS